MRPWCVRERAAACLLLAALRLPLVIQKHAQPALNLRCAWSCVQSAGAAAVAEMAQLGPALAVPLLQFGLCVYHLSTDLLCSLRPDVV